jgi:hypothetical protein
MPSPILDELNVAEAICQRVRSICAKKLLKAPSRLLPPSDIIPIAPLPLSLPIPESIVSSLIDAGCPFDKASSLSDDFVRCAREHRVSFRALYAKTSRRITSHSDSNPHKITRELKHLALVLEAHYLKQLSTAEQGVLKQARAQHQQPHPLKAVKASFNQVCHKCNSMIFLRF